MLASRILHSHDEPVRAGNNLSQFLALVLSRKQKESQQFEYQATDFVRALALLAKNGVPLAVAIEWLAGRMELDIGKILKDAASDLKLSADINELLDQWELLPSSTMAELSQKLRVSLERGTPVAQQLEQLAASALSKSHTYLLRKAGSNETKMLIPTIFLILPITILFTIYPSLSLLQNKL